MKHPVYEIAQENGGYITAAQTARLIRTVLTRNFWKQKFSVRSEEYAGGSSINVRWTDGPRAEDVEKVVSVFKCAGFDGSIDYAYSKRFWLYPDGNASLGVSEGTTDCGGYVEGYKRAQPREDAIECSGADYIFCRRELSPETRAQALGAYPKKFHDDVAAAIEAGKIWVNNQYDGYFEADAEAISIQTPFGVWATEALERFARTLSPVA